jgi:glucose-6-phosphate 1-dehydrogenase
VVSFNLFLFPEYPCWSDLVTLESQRLEGAAPSGQAAAEPCVVVIFGASGDLTKRLLMPAFYNLVCDGLLPEQFCILGTAMDPLTTESFRERMSNDIRKFSTRPEFNEKEWDRLCSRLYYTPGKFDDDSAFKTMSDMVAKLDSQYQTKGNVLFYMATPPSVFGLISDQLEKAGLSSTAKGWKRIIVEKPFGTDLPSAIALNREILKYWTEDKIFRIDHYLGKETVQNIIAFRFSNGMFEPLWNRNYVDHIQFSVSELVGVEGRGGYYDRSGVLRDMIQNHMFQMLAYLCMEPPTSFAPEAVRNEKAKVLEAVRIMDPEMVRLNTVRGQYGPGHGPDGKPCPGYRQEDSVPPQSNTETFAAMKLLIDNWRWSGVPIYLRSGKRLWKRGTEIIVQLKSVPDVVFRGSGVESLDPNRLIFHIQPDQGIELQFHAKTPGPAMTLQKVNMRFDYGEAFSASRGTGYEVLIYNCMNGDATLFSRTDLVETAWRIAQPLLDLWKTEPADFPNYPAGSWGPKAAFDLIERDGRKWGEVLNRETLEKIPLFHGGDAVFLNSVIMALKPVVFQQGELVIRKGEIGRAMYIIARGEVEVINDAGEVVATLGEGNYFGEISLLLSEPRTATVRASAYSDCFMLDKADFNRVLRDRPQFLKAIRETATTRYNVTVPEEKLLEEMA